MGSLQELLLTSIAPQRISEVVDEAIEVGHVLQLNLARISDAEAQGFDEVTLAELLTAVRAIRNALRGVAEVANLEARRLGL